MYLNEIVFCVFLIGYKIAISRLLCRKDVEPIHKWLPMINSSASIKISLPNVVFKLLIENNFFSQSKWMRLI